MVFVTDPFMGLVLQLCGVQNRGWADFMAEFNTVPLYGTRTAELGEKSLCLRFDGVYITLFLCTVGSQL